MAGYSKTPLRKKLSLKENMICKVINPPDHYLHLIHPIPDGVQFISDTREDFDFIHFFVNDSEVLSAVLPLLMKEIKKGGMIWISWYKKSSKKQQSVNEDVIREVALPLGLVDVKVCAIDAEWSALKVVYRLEYR